MTYKGIMLVILNFSTELEWTIHKVNVFLRWQGIPLRGSQRIVTSAQAGAGTAREGFNFQYTSKLSSF